MNIERPSSIEGKTYKIETGCGTSYITISNLDSPYYEIFATLGKTGGCPSATLQSLTRCLTVGLNLSKDPERLIKRYIKQLIGIGCPHSTKHIPSCVESIGIVLQKHYHKPFDPDEEETPK